MLTCEESRIEKENDRACENGLAWLALGGQGSVTANKLLMEAKSWEGERCKATYAPTPDRRGKPVFVVTFFGSESAVKGSDFNKKGNYVALLSGGFDDAFERVVKGGTIIADKSVTGGYEKISEEFPEIVDYNIALIDCTSICKEKTKEKFGFEPTGFEVKSSMAALGAISRIGLASPESVKGAIRERWNGKLADLNLEIFSEAYGAVEIYETPRAEEPIHGKIGKSVSLSSFTDAAIGFAEKGKRGSLEIPMLDGECVQCGYCEEVCHTGALKYRPHGNGDSYLFLSLEVEGCSGCGTCEEECGSGAIKLAPREEAFEGEGIEYVRE